MIATIRGRTHLTHVANPNIRLVTYGLNRYETSVPASIPHRRRRRTERPKIKDFRPLRLQTYLRARLGMCIATYHREQANTGYLIQCFGNAIRRTIEMLWTIFVILLIMYLLGLVSSYTLGGFIHLLLLLALVVLVINLVSGRRPAL